ncbi:MAG TPA: FAD-dependent monooxygenase [Trebonia sp.]|jgi:2-polyprenyl-6-methoxyphenol hydroxylase-like FAD-dependent oxidoreductase|nr:FAD-dependent monooxygenase [Trebonia sp.]
MRETNTDQAVVLGGSMAGLLAARVLAERFGRVVVIDRDPLPPAGEQRRGVPQGRHVHALHPRGLDILNELFPGFSVSVAASGAVLCDILADARWQLSGSQLRHARAGTSLFASRPLLEGHVRAMVQQRPEVRFRPETSIHALTVTADKTAVTGVEVRGPDGQSSRVAASLVVDATGRGSRTPVWLAELGYPRPAEDRVEIGLGYASRRYRLRPGAMGQDQAILTAGTTANPRAAVLAATEGGRHILTTAGICGDFPPTDPAGLDEFVARLPTGDIAAALAGAEPLDDPVPYRFPASVRRRYERLAAFPAGLLVIGDAACSFNPIYGQGMTVAATEAMTLRAILARGARPGARRYFRAIAAAIDPPWDIAVGSDLAFPQVPGKRSAKVRLVNAYLPRLHAAAARDDALAAAMIRVIGLRDRPEGLLRPDRMLRVLRGNLPGGRRPALALAPPAVPASPHGQRPVTSS